MNVGISSWVLIRSRVSSSLIVKNDVSKNVVITVTPMNNMALFIAVPRFRYFLDETLLPLFKTPWFSC